MAAVSKLVGYVPDSYPILDEGVKRFHTDQLGGISASLKSIRDVLTAVKAASVTGPTPTVVSNVALWNNTTGTLLKDGGTLAVVAFTGNYADLSGKPTLGTAAAHADTDFQTALGFTPVQQGTGVGQLTNTIKIGWSGSILKATVDVTDLGEVYTSSARPIGTSSNNLVQLNGSSQLPAVSGALLTNLPASTGSLISYQNASATGTVVIPAGVTSAFVRMSGGSGGGCGVALNISYSGAGGGLLEKLLSGLTPGNTLSLTIGAAGAAGTSGVGGNGGDTILASGTQTITTLTASGGVGGGTSGVPAAGGGTNGDTNRSGQPGFPCTWDGNNGTPQFSSVPGGMTAGGFGCGGTSAGRSGTATAGINGRCLIMWFK